MKLNIPVTEKRLDSRTQESVGGMKERLQYLRRTHGVNLSRLIDLVIEIAMDPAALAAAGVTPESVNEARKASVHTWPVTYSFPFTCSDNHRSRIEVLRAAGYPIAELVRTGLRPYLRMDPEELIGKEPDILYKSFRVRREKKASAAEDFDAAAATKVDVAEAVNKIIAEKMGLPKTSFEDHNHFPEEVSNSPDELKWRGRLKEDSASKVKPAPGEWYRGRLTPLETVWDPPLAARQTRGGIPIGIIWPTLRQDQREAFVRAVGDFEKMRDIELTERCERLYVNASVTPIAEVRLILRSANDPDGARREMQRLHGTSGPLKRPRGRPPKSTIPPPAPPGKIIDLETVVAERMRTPLVGPVNVESDYVPGQDPEGAKPRSKPVGLRSFTDIGEPEMVVLSSELNWSTMSESYLSTELMRRGLMTNLDYDDTVEHLRSARPATDEARKAYERIVDLRSILGEMSALSNGEIVRSVRALRDERFGNGMLSAKLGDFERLRSPNPRAQWVLLPPPDPIGDDDLEPIRANYGSLLPPKTSHLKVYCPGLTPEPIDMRHVPALLEEIERRIQIVMEGAVPTPRNKQVVPPKPPQRPETRPSALDALAFLSSKLVKPPAETTPKSTNVTSGGRQLSALHVAEQARAPVTLRPLSALRQYEMMHLRDPATMTDVEIVLLLDSMGYEGTPADYRALFQEEKRSITDLTGADLSEILDEFGGGAAFDEMTDEEVKQYFEAGWNVDASDVQAIRQHIKPKS